MEEMNNQDSLYKELTPAEKKQKSLNRFFGLFLLLDIALGILLIISLITLAL